MSIRSVLRPVRRVFPALLMGVVIAACSDSSPMGPDGRSIETVLTEDVTGLSLAPVQGLAGDPIDFLGLGVISVPGPPGPPLPTNVTVEVA